MTGVRERTKRRNEKIAAEAAVKEKKKFEEAATLPARRRRKRRKQTGDETVAEQKEKKKKKPSYIRSRPTRRDIPEDRRDVEVNETADADGSLIPRKISRILEDRFIFDLMNALEVNQAITIVRKKEDVWKLVVGGQDIVQSALRLTGTAYWNEVLSEEYQEHKEEWGMLTPEEKIDTVVAAGIEWEEHEVSRINLMRCADAYQQSLNLQKYKPQYRNFKARKAVREDGP